FSLSGVPVTGISLDAEQIGLNVGERRTVKATAAPEDASDTRVTWASADPTIATVVDGRIAAVGAGTTTVTAASVSDPALTDTVSITVTDAEYPTVRLDAQLTDAANWSTADGITV